MVFFQNLVYTAPLIVIAYLLGSLNFAIIFSKVKYHEDIRERGSGNAGATNIRRNYGSKWGYFTGCFDVMKLIIAMLIAYLFKIYLGVFSQIYLGLVGLSVIIGHIYPVFFSFNGGKGASCLLGLLIVFDWWLFPVGALTFFLIVKKWRIVSLGSLIAPGMWILSALIFNLGFYYADISVFWNIPIANTEPWWCNILYLLAGYLIIILKHISNIKRLIHHNESTIT